jgi:hypothetical protein
MNRNSKLTPEWKAPDTLLPKVMAAVAYTHQQAPQGASWPGRILSAVITAGLCVIVAIAGGILLGIIPDPLASLTGLAQPVMNLWRVLSVLDNTAAGLIQALLKNRTTAIALCMYGAFLLFAGLCSIRGLVYLFNSTSYPRRHSI